MPFKSPKDSKEHDLSWLDLSAVCDLDLDSRTVIFTEIGQAPGQDYFLYLRKTDGSPAVKLGEAFTGAISPDGKWVLSVSAENPSRLVLIPTGAGDAKILSGQWLTQFSGPSWTPDAKMVAYVATDGHAWRLYVQDLEGGKPRPVTPELSTVSPYETQLVSPDGKLVFGRDLERKGYKYPLDGSTPSEIPGLEVKELFAGWAADSRSVFVVRPYSYPVKVFKLDVSTGARKVIREILPQDLVGLDSVFAIRVSRDEKSIVYSYERSLSELYLVSGLR